MKSLHLNPHHLFFLAPETCCGEPEEVVVIIGVDALEKGVDKLLAVAGEDPVMVSVEEDHAWLDSRRGRSGSRVVGEWRRHFHDMRGSFTFPEVPPGSVTKEETPRPASESAVLGV